MSSPIWTPGALSSELTALDCAAWRMVEAQHRVSTLKLVDSLEEQALLEAIVEDTKPAVPPSCRGLHYLLMTPFRYPAKYASRFRPAYSATGLFYGAAMPETAIAEIIFYRLLFYAESPDTPLPTNPGEFTGFAVRLKTRAAIDLTRTPFSENAQAFTHHRDYAACHALADAALECGTEVIAYASVRCPRQGKNFAVLDPKAFAQKEPSQMQSWRILLRGDGALATCEAPHLSLRFALADFARDERLAPFARRAA